jgi:DNA-binding protein YbaB
VEPTGRPDVAGLAAFAESLRSTAERMATEGPQLQEKARQVQVTETSRDGLVSVTVGSRGELIRLDIDPRVFRRPDSRELADTITTTIQRAAAAAQERVLDVMDPLVPRATLRRFLDGDTEGVVSDMTDRMHGRQ